MPGRSIKKLQRLVRRREQSDQIALDPPRKGRKSYDSDIRGKEVRGCPCIYALVRWCDACYTHAMVMNDEHKKSAKKCKKVIDNFKIV